jgi:hypothetical protein
LAAQVVQSAPVQPFGQGTVPATQLPLLQAAASVFVELMQD